MQQQILRDDDSLQQPYSTLSEQYFKESFLNNHHTYIIAKRIFDIVFSSILLIITSPIFLVTTIAIKLDSPGSIFYKSVRIGQNGKLFGMLKFRSMRRDADKLLLSMSEEQRNEYNKTIKIKNDDRITRVGKIIRRASIDELPQLWNTLIGDMSVIGPRPPLPIEEPLLGDKLYKIMVTPPGISGPWQVNGRNDIEYDKRIDLNEEYIDNFGAVQDMKILLKTVSVVFTGRGAA